MARFDINMKRVMDRICLGAREHKIYLSEVTGTAMSIKIMNDFNDEFSNLS